VKVAVSVEGGVITKVQVIIEIASQCDQSTSVTGNKKYTVVVHT
jgi:isopentenyl phosphate kinase